MQHKVDAKLSRTQLEHKRDRKSNTATHRIEPDECSSLHSSHRAKYLLPGVFDTFDRFMDGLKLRA